MSSIRHESSNQEIGQAHNLLIKDYSQIQDLLQPHTHLKTQSAMKVLQFANGVYQGHINKDNQLNGLGLFFWKNSQIYYGQWQQNQMTGRGIIVFPQGGYVYGHFKNNFLEGKFKLVFPNQDIMFAYCSQGFFQGKAIRKFKDTSQYIQCQYEKGNMITIDCKLTKAQFKHRKKLEFNELINMKEFFDHISQLQQNSQNINKFNEDYDIYDQFNNQMKCLMISNQEIYFGSTKFNFPRGYGVKLHLKCNLIQRGRFLDGLLDGRGRKNFLNGDIYDGGFTEGQISNSGLFYDNTNFSCYRGFFEYNKLITLFAIFQTRFPSSQYEYEKYENKDIDCNLEIQSECIFFTQKEALFMIDSLHLLGKKYILNSESVEKVLENNELIAQYKLKSSLKQQQVKYVELKAFQQEPKIGQILIEKNQNQALAEQNQNQKVDEKQKIGIAKSAKSLLPPLSRKASLLEGQQGNANIISTSVLNSTLPFSSQYNSNTSSNTTFLQQNQGEFLNTDNNSQQSSYFSKQRSIQQAHYKSNSNMAQSSDLVKKVSFCDEIKKISTQVNKTTSLQNSFLEQAQNLPSNEIKNQIKMSKISNENKSKEDLIYIYDFKDQQISNQQQKNQQIDFDSNNCDFLSLNYKSRETQKQNYENQSVIIEKSIDIYDSNESLQEVNNQNEINFQSFNIENNKSETPHSLHLKQQLFNQIANQDDEDQIECNYLELSPQNEQQLQNENHQYPSSSRLYSSDFSQTRNDNQKENSNQQHQQLNESSSQSIKSLINKSQNTNDFKDSELDKKEIQNLKNENALIDHFEILNDCYQEEEEPRKRNQQYFNNEITLNSNNSSNLTIDYMTKSVQFYDSDQNSAQINKSDKIQNHQNCPLQNISFEQYFQILQQNQNIQQESGQFTLTFSKNNDSTINQYQDQMNHNKNNQSHKSISQNFLVGTPQDYILSYNDSKVQKQTRNDFSTKLKQIVQHKQLQFQNQKQQDQIEKVNQKTILSENQIVDSNITTDQSYSYHQFKLQNQNQQQKISTSNTAYENRFSFCNNTSFKDDIYQQNQHYDHIYQNNIEQEDEQKETQRRNNNKQGNINSFANKENISKIEKIQQNEKTKIQKQQVKVIQIDLLQEISQNNLIFEADKYEKNNIYVPQIACNSNQQYQNQHSTKLSQPVQYDYNQKQSAKNTKQAGFYKQNHRKQNSETFQNFFEEAQQKQKINNLNTKLQRKQSTGSFHINHSNQIQKMVSSKSQTLLKQLSQGDLHTKNNSEESSTKILKQISSKQFQGQKAIFQKLIEFKYMNKLAQMN
ncbi:hypothetical protein ABPG74_004117 [Tetrahymena malaccensis]